MTEVIRELEIRKVIENLLIDVAPRLFYEKAAKDTPYPYAVYEISDSIDDGSLEDMELEVNGWDKPSNGSSIELATLMGNIDNKLHRSINNSNGVFFSIYRENRRAIRDPDESIRRRQMTYQIRLMGVGM
ncbi:hypothetical protein [Oceanobacillus damuensis]|uniref:hypothetical protein n=1 Tax=Oceanobacillus damuensis TaxID=937928 RepID=UPI00083600B0|nr:hypothetical protein [Oceanobacillus damuensis]